MNPKCPHSFPPFNVNGKSFFRVNFSNYSSFVKYFAYAIYLSPSIKYKKMFGVYSNDLLGNFF